MAVAVEHEQKTSVCVVQSSAVLCGVGDGLNFPSFLVGLEQHANDIKCRRRRCCAASTSSTHVRQSLNSAHDRVVRVWQQLHCVWCSFHMPPFKVVYCFA